MRPAFRGLGNPSRASRKYSGLMRNRPLLLILLCFLVGVLIAAPTHRIWPVPLALSVGLALVLFAYWQGLREGVRRAYAAPIRWRWSDETPELGPDGEVLEGEWRGLGYRHLGTLRGEGEGGPPILSSVYVHPELPVYLRIWPQQNQRGKLRTAAQLVTFFPQRGRLATTNYPGLALFTGGIPSPGPRLLQYRHWGAPLDLDGQHLGTLKAWMAGGREPLPATAEALPGYLEEDYAWTREALAQFGWLPIPHYLRSLAGRPPGTLTW